MSPKGLFRVITVSFFELARNALDASVDDSFGLPNR